VHQRGTISTVALVWVLLAIVVLGGVAVVAAGRGEGLTAAEPDRPDLSMPLDRPFMRTDVDQLRFSVGLRGYRMDEVDDVLDRLAYDLEARDARIAVLEQEVAARWTAATAPGAEPAVVAEPAVHVAEPGEAPPAEDVDIQAVADADESELARAQEALEPEEAEEAEEVDEVDEGELLVGRTLIVPFQQTDSRFGQGAGADGEPSAGPGTHEPAPDERPEQRA
jgi:DivIVA domain-containing protein